VHVRDFRRSLRRQAGGRIAIALPAARPSPKRSPWQRAPDLFDTKLIKDYAGFALRSIRRHPLLALPTFAFVVAASVAALIVLPKTYHSEVKILVERNQVMAALGNPGRTIPSDADAPTRAASERVVRRENLVALIKQTDLIDEWEATRAPASRVKDALFRLFQGAPTDEQRIDSLAGLLERRLKVETGPGTVTIGIDWPNAQMAFRLIEAAQENFLEARHLAEVSGIAETISILEGHVANLHEVIHGQLGELRQARESRPAEDAPSSLLPSLQHRSRAEQRLAQIQLMLGAKRRAIAYYEGAQARKVADLRTRLSEQKVTYAAAHPLVLSTIESIARLSKEWPQIVALRRDEESLVRDYKREGGRDASFVSRARSLAAPPRSDVTEPWVDDSTEYEKTRLRITLDTYEELLGRVEAAQIELDTARAAFKYRYNIIRPAQVPKRAEKPDVPLALLGGVLSGLLLALLVCLIKDSARGRLMERWQIERWLQLPVIAEVNRP
jgi:hypothetical protein